MSNSDLPSQITDAIAGIPKALVPASLKALDRLIGAAVDIPVAWMAQYTGKIDAKTASYKLVEGAIAEAVAKEVVKDEATVQRALSALISREYRKQSNREAVAAAMVDDLRANKEAPTSTEQEPTKDPDPVLIEEDWLNVFERYAEDASTDKMQGLWGRVLAGEIRKPGSYSMRTLRFLSEFSQADALAFSEFSSLCFGDLAPNALVKPKDTKNIKDLVYLESIGLVQGAYPSLNKTIGFNKDGRTYLMEGNIVIIFEGGASSQLSIPCCVLTSLGQELLKLIPARDVRTVARNVAKAIKSDKTIAAYLAILIPETQQLLQMETLWQRASEEAAPSSPSN